MLLLLIVVSLVRRRVRQSLGFLCSSTCSLLDDLALSGLDGKIVVMVMVLVILVATLVETSLIHTTLLH